MKKVKKPEFPEKTPGDELQEMPHTNARKHYVALLAVIAMCLC